ncbi:MAG: four helix bundle protein [Flexilinea sp.]|nr:four helix bundle protein [Flexilinea sp.]
MSDNPALEKSKYFSVRIVRLYKHLVNTKNEHVMAKQLLRSGTSVGANISEGQYAVTKKDFLNKFQIALKECKETEYWLELLHNTDYLTDKEFLSIYNDCRELLFLLIAITDSTKKKLIADKGKKEKDILSKSEETE